MNYFGFCSLLTELCTVHLRGRFSILESGEHYGKS